MKHKKHFYSHIVEIDSLTIKLDELDLSIGEKNHLIELMHSNLHHTIIDAILSELNSNDKKHFLHVLSSENHDEIWKFLNTKVGDIEEKIKKAAESLKQELHEDIKEAKNK